MAKDCSPSAQAFLQQYKEKHLSHTRMWNWICYSYLVSHWDDWHLLSVLCGVDLVHCPAVPGLRISKTNLSQKWKANHCIFATIRPPYNLTVTHASKDFTFLNHLSCLGLGEFDEHVSKANLHLFCMWQELVGVIPPLHMQWTSKAWRHSPEHVPLFSAFSASLFLFLFTSRSIIWDRNTI